MGTVIVEGIVVQERDLDMLVGLFECRVMSLRHITQLYFDGKAEAAKKRIQKLKAAGLVKERPRMIGEPSILHLSKRAFAALRESGRLISFPSVTGASLDKRAHVSEITLRHELEVMNVRTAFFSAVRKDPQLSLPEFSTWPLLYQFNARINDGIVGRKQIVMKPDGFLRLREKEGDDTFEHLFFLEVDRSTETQEIIAQKAACYLDYYQTGGMALRFGGQREDFRQYPFRVLMVFKNEERRNNAAERLLRNTPPILTQVWLTTSLEAIIAPLGNIWMRPKDYLEAMKGSRFDPTTRISDTPYRSQREREAIIQAKVVKHRLLGNANFAAQTDSSDPIKK